MPENSNADVSSAGATAYANAITDVPDPPAYRAWALPPRKSILKAGKLSSDNIKEFCDARTWSANKGYRPEGVYRRADTGYAPPS